MPPHQLVPPTSELDDCLLLTPAQQHQLEQDEAQQLLETEGLPTYEGPASLLEALLAPGGLYECDLRSIRTLSALNRQWKETADSENVWRLCAGAMAEAFGLYAPNDCASWKNLCQRTLWPARRKWRAASEAEGESQGGVGFQIQVAVRVRPRKHGRSSRGVILPLHQRLKTLKKGEKLTFESAALPADQIAEMAREQGDLPPEVFQALLEAAQLEASAKQAQQQAAQNRAGGSGSGGAVEEAGEAGGEASGGTTGGDAQQAAAAAVAAAGGEAGAGGKGGGDKSAAGKDKDKENSSANEEVEGGEARGGNGGGARLLLVQPTRVTMFVPGVGVRPFLFSSVLDERAEQRRVYQSVAQDSVASALNGLNACVLAYGQTGSGKTHTVFGPDGAIAEALASSSTRNRRRAALGGLGRLGAATALPQSAGLVLRACEEVLACAAAPGPACKSLAVTASYVQIYNDEVTDLLSGALVRPRDTGGGAAGRGGPGGSAAFVLQGAQQLKLETIDDALALLQAGEARKRFAATAMNEHSSRAHTVFLLSLTQVAKSTGPPTPGNAAGAAGAEVEEVVEEEGAGTMLTSQLALVDLAGCEQLSQSKAVGQQLREAVGINSSLLVLGKCITALSEGRAHVPYHEARLTMLLRGAFGGNSRTTCCVTVSPDDAHAANSVQALRFGERCTTITNTARVAATSVAAALSAIDDALATCARGMRNLEGRGKTELPAYKNLKARHDQLQTRRQQMSSVAR